MKTYIVGFNGNDETELDAENLKDFLQVFLDFSKENEVEKVDYVNEI